MARAHGYCRWVTCLLSALLVAALADEATQDVDSVFFMQIQMDVLSEPEVTRPNKNMTNRTRASRGSHSAQFPGWGTDLPDDVDMKTPPDLGAAVPFFDMEGVPVHWHAFIWLTVLLTSSVATVTVYCCRGFLPDRGASEEPVKEPSAKARTRAKALSGQDLDDAASVGSPSKWQSAAAQLPARQTVHGDQLEHSTSRNMDHIEDEREQNMRKERAILVQQSSRTSARRRSWHLMRDWANLQKETWSTRDGHETMSSAVFVLNIVADLCPSGFLSIAYGMDGTGYLPAFAIMVVSCACSCYTMWMVGRACEITGEYDYAAQWASAIGPRAAWVPNLVICVVALGALLCYACYFGDLLQEVTPAFGYAVPRYACVIGVSLFPTLPLCYLKNFSALGCSSGFAFIALLYTAAVMSMRAYDGTYAKDGHFYKELPGGLRPDLPWAPDHAPMWQFRGESLVYINILAMAFHCHCNACKYYRELHKSTPAHFGRCTLVAMVICACIYVVMGYMGYKTFGLAAEGTILKNYSVNDWPVNVAKCGVVLSLIASYVIMFAALRESSLSLLKSVGESWVGNLDLIWRQDVLSTVLVVFITSLAVLCQSSGLVDGLVGAICGNVVIYIIPGLIYAASVKAFFDKSRNMPSIASSVGLVVLGVALIIAGCFCIFYYELPKASTQFKDIAIYEHADEAVKYSRGPRYKRGRNNFWFR